MDPLKAGDHMFSFFSDLASAGLLGSDLVKPVDVLDVLGDAGAAVRDESGEPVEGLALTAMDVLPPDAAELVGEQDIVRVVQSATPGAPASLAVCGLSDGSLWLAALPGRGAAVEGAAVKLQSASLLGKMFGLLSTPFRSRNQAPPLLSLHKLPGVPYVLALSADLVFSLWSLEQRAVVGRFSLAHLTDDPVELGDAGILDDIVCSVVPDIDDETTFAIVVFVPLLANASPELVASALADDRPELFVFALDISTLRAADDTAEATDALQLRAVECQFTRDPAVAGARPVDVLYDAPAGALHVLYAMPASMSADGFQIWSYTLDGSASVQPSTLATHLGSLDHLELPGLDTELNANELHKVYAGEVFYPGRFSATTLALAVQAYHGSRMSLLEGAAAPAPAVLRQVASNAVTAHAAAVAASAGDSPAAYAEALVAGWEAILEHCIRLARAETAPLALGLLPAIGVEPAGAVGLVVLCSGALAVACEVGPATDGLFALTEVPETNVGVLEPAEADARLVHQLVDLIDVQLGGPARVRFFRALLQSRNPLTAAIPDVGQLTESEASGRFVLTFLRLWRSLHDPVAAVQGAVARLVASAQALTRELEVVLALGAEQAFSACALQSAAFVASRSVRQARALLLTLYLVAQLRDDSRCSSDGHEVMLSEVVPATEVVLMRSVVAAVVVRASKHGRGGCGAPLVSGLSQASVLAVLAGEAGSWLVRELLASGEATNAHVVQRLLESEALLRGPGEAGETGSARAQLVGEAYLHTGEFGKARNAFRRVDGDVNYFAEVMQKFDESYQPDLALEFAQVALGCAGESSEMRAVLWSNVFKHACALHDYDSAYLAIASNPDPERRQDCLRRFVVVLCELGEGVRLCEYPFVGLCEEVEATLLRKGRSGHANYYEVLYAWHCFRSNFRAAAGAMYERGCMAATADDALRGYLAAATALNLVGASSAWILHPRQWRHAADGGTGKRRHESVTQVSDELAIVSLAGVTMETAIVRAWALLGTDARPEDADGAVLALATSGYIDEAFLLAKLCDASVEPVFGVLVDKAMAAAPSATADAVVPGWELPLGEEWWGAPSLRAALWRVILDGLARYDSPQTGFRYHLVVAHCVLTFDRRTALPRSLVVSLVAPDGAGSVNVANVAALARLYLSFGCAGEAAALALEFLGGDAGSAAAKAGVESFGAWLPYQVLDEIALSEGQEEFRAAMEALLA
ncbi:uncharacterized protein AMSG_03387 [Thecamonas trahens ATCC 50062]|uniref:Nuclear pore complex protein Nup160 n=1 Tax=Thecamonas trahens ATCC 50062 TaxID=461836 RepID=A0A0L0D3S2_THETB|nr:hypothetical protein AMSG_03387 [Thecamonas trahens ATCC 50062]KNC46954.1 hypothetical protein AMSG_03387 [Thecamonas trahens ATCC 50062]|eukprot:XP_013760225.1 hypothetical protein AMSG_03387 [Thecamonas trahens ATCC 50062]